MPYQAFFHGLNTNLCRFSLVDQGQPLPYSTFARGSFDTEILSLFCFPRDPGGELAFRSMEDHRLWGHWLVASPDSPFSCLGDWSHMGSSWLRWWCNWSRAQDQDTQSQSPKLWPTYAASTLLQRLPITTISHVHLKGSSQVEQSVGVLINGPRSRERHALLFICSTVQTQSVCCMSTAKVLYALSESL